MYRNKLRIGSSAVGRDGRLRITNAVDFMQDCACFHLEDNPVLSRYFREEHCGMYLIYRQVEIVSRPYYNEKITSGNGNLSMQSRHGKPQYPPFGQRREGCFHRL